jgi:cytochrome c oxidase subunit 2
VALRAGPPAGRFAGLGLEIGGRAAGRHEGGVRMTDTTEVLNGLIAVYSLYAVAIIAVVAWFARRVTASPGTSGIRPAFFYAFVGFLVVIGVSLHIITYNTIPWAPLDLNKASITPDQTITITVGDHRFRLPQERLTVKAGQKVRFNVLSEDLTYGFGVFRPDNTMVFQMQVVPGHDNDIVWQFARPGLYTIRSTEYSGPRGARMVLPGALEVVD